MNRTESCLHRFYPLIWKLTLTSADTDYHLIASSFVFNHYFSP